MKRRSGTRRMAASWMRGVIGLLAVCLWFSSAPPVAQAADTELSARLQRALGARALRGADLGVLVVRESDGELIFQQGADRPLIPASNQKLLTSMAALDVFGPTHRFETLLYSQAPPNASGRIGDLIVRGGGDPATNSEDWMRLALELRSLGVRRVGGDIVLDDSAFDRERWHSSWGATGSRAYHAPIGALTANYGHFVVNVRPGARAGEPVQVEISPPVAYLQLDNQAVTRAGKSSLEVTRKASPEGETVRVRGSMRLGSRSKPFYRSVLNPTRYAGAVLRWQLESNGIAVAGKLRPGVVPKSAVELHRFEGRQLSEIVKLFMKYSNNGVAETLVKAMGARSPGSVGSWVSGVSVMRAALVGRGLDLHGVEIVDGSGLSTGNRVTARVLVNALRAARSSFRFGPEFSAALPIAGLDGTLEKRADASSGRVRAKTGQLTSVSSLSGYAILGSGEVGVFSILANEIKSSSSGAMDAIDHFVQELTRTPK